MTRDYSADYFRQLSRGSRASAEIVVPLIVDLVYPNSVVDLGCGTGAWLAEFKRRGVNSVLGIDGPYVDTGQLEIGTNEFLAADLARPVSLDGRFDLALSLEVAEHLAAEHAEQFVKTLAQIAPIVVFSAAIPGQGGEQHLNEQWPSYWIERFAVHDFIAFDPFRRQLWQLPAIDWWYAQNILLFVHRSSPWYAKFDSDRCEILPLVHPRNLIDQVWRNRVLQLAVELASHVPTGEQLIVADENRFGTMYLPGRRVRAFIERNGIYFGPPETDAEAIRELERMKQEGARYLAIGWPAFWWLSYYRDFAEHLERCYPAALKNQLVTLYCLRP